MTAAHWRFAGLALVVMCAAWGGARLYLAQRSATAGGMPVPVGEASPPTASDREATEEGPRPTRIPDRLPQFSLPDLAGKPTSIDAWTGRSLVLNFWATWCAPCRREIPLLQRLGDAWADRGVTVIGVAVDRPDSVRDFARQLHIGYPLLLGEQDALDVADSLGVTTPVFPFTVFTDRRGQVLALYLGELHQAQAELILAEVQNMNRDREDLPQARRRIESGLKALAGSTRP